MWERLLVLFIALGGAFFIDFFVFKEKAKGKEKFVYAIIIAVSVFIGLDYVNNKDWPDIYDLVDVLLGSAAETIEQALKVDWSN